MNFNNFNLNEIESIVKDKIVPLLSNNNNQMNPKVSIGNAGYPGSHSAHQNHSLHNSNGNHHHQHPGNYNYPGNCQNNYNGETFYPPPPNVTQYNQPPQQYYGSNQAYNYQGNGQIPQQPYNYQGNGQIPQQPYNQVPAAYNPNVSNYNPGAAPYEPAISPYNPQFNDRNQVQPSYGAQTSNSQPQQTFNQNVQASSGSQSPKQNALPAYSAPVNSNPSDQPNYVMPKNDALALPEAVAPVVVTPNKLTMPAAPIADGRDPYAKDGKPVDIYNHFGTNASLLTAEQVQFEVSSLHKAMKGFGTNDSVLTTILGRLTPEQMEQVSQAYKSNYGRDLIKEVTSEVGGDYGRLCVALVTSQPVNDAINIHKALSGIGADEALLIEVLCCRSNAEMTAIKVAYKEKYSKELEHALEKELSGDLKRLFIMLVQATRDESNVVGNVDADVEALYQAGEGRLGTDEDIFLSIMCNRSVPHLQAIFQGYDKRTGHSFEHAIKSEFSGKLEKALLALMYAYRNYYLYISELFESSMAGLGTNDEMLIRLVARFRAPRHLTEVKRNFQLRYRKTLDERVKSEASGSYGRLLAALIGN